ncbi:protein JTB-like [Oscarella lobularis]|uniref:protein JTB-like n=1 Tax=Oscarella lobularis TaxID=121494 RepID=UPI0033134CEC
MKSSLLLRIATCLSLCIVSVLSDESGRISTSPCSPIEECKACSKFQKKTNLEECGETGKHQLHNCNGKKKFMSCNQVKVIEEMKFWIFESTAFTVGLFSIVAVLVRQRKLDREALQRIRKQVASTI